MKVFRSQEGGKTLKKTDYYSAYQIRGWRREYTNNSCISEIDRMGEAVSGKWKAAPKEEQGEGDFD